jgi:hypothetical protein
MLVRVAHLHFSMWSSSWGALYRITATIRAQLGDETFQAAWAEGRKMTLEQAAAYALEE